MKTPGDIARALLLVGAIVVSLCACEDRLETKHQAAPQAAPTAGQAAAPALWEPIDESFKGCEGG